MRPTVAGELPPRGLPPPQRVRAELPPRQANTVRTFYAPVLATIDRNGRLGPPFRSHSIRQAYQETSCPAAFEEGAGLVAPVGVAPDASPGEHRPELGKLC